MKKYYLPGSNGEVALVYLAYYNKNGLYLGLKSRWFGCELVDYGSVDAVHAAAKSEGLEMLPLELQMMGRD